MIHFIAINKETNEPLEDTATVIGAESEEDAVRDLQEHLKTCGHNINGGPIEWIIDGNPQILKFGKSNVICTRYYG